MRQYPTRKGRPIDPYEIGYTEPRKADYREHKVDRHHLFYPNSAFQTPLRRMFRSEVHNVVPMIQTEHNGKVSLHNTYSPPPIPSDLVMIEFCETILEEHGQLTLVRKKDIHVPLIITPEQFERIAHERS